MSPFAFIVGRGRSGTTLVRAQLDSHPEMAVVQEAHFLSGLVRARRSFELPGGGFDTDAFVRRLAAHRSFFRLEMPADEIAAVLATPAPRTLAEAVRRIYARYAAVRGKERYGDKTPGNVMHIEMLGDVFPESRFVHVIRDGRDSTLSYLDASFGPSSVAEAALYWRRFVAGGRRAGERLGTARYKEIRYERLVADPEETLREVCVFLGLPFDEAMLRYHERAAELVGKVHHNLARPPTQGIRDWRRDMSREDVVLFEALAGDLLDELGYERAAPRIPASGRVRALRARLAVNGGRIARRASGARSGTTPGGAGEARR